MTTVTDSEIGSTRDRTVGQQDSPAVRAGTRARIPVTQSIGKIAATRTSALLAIRCGARRWWVWTSRPASLVTTWRLSAVDPKRIPGNSALLRLLWTGSNRTDRLAMFAIVLVAPTFLTGPLRWFVQRPTRRWGLYLVLMVFAAVTWLT